MPREIQKGFPARLLQTQTDQRLAAATAVAACSGRIALSVLVFTAYRLLALIPSD